MAFVTAERTDENGKKIKEENTYDYDEYAQIRRCVYRTSVECAQRTLGWNTVNLSHIVTELSVHEQDKQKIAFVEGFEARAEAAIRRGEKRSKLEAFFQLCKHHQEATGRRLDLTYAEVPQLYWFDGHSKVRRWILRKRTLDNLLSRVMPVTPKNPELFAIRLLLLRVKGPTSFADLRTVDGPHGTRVQHNRFVEAAQAIGLLENPTTWVQAVRDAAKQYKNDKM